MLKNLLDMEPGDPIAPRILQDFLTFMEGFVSLPLYIPGSPYAKAVKVINSNASSSGYWHLIFEITENYAFPSLLVMHQLN